MLFEFLVSFCELQGTIDEEIENGRGGGYISLKLNAVKLHFGLQMTSIRWLSCKQIFWANYDAVLTFDTFSFSYL